MRLQIFFVVSVSSLLIGCASNSYESRPFFQHEYAAESHGQKTFSIVLSKPIQVASRLRRRRNT
jgi:hypothetical protein